MNYYAIETDAYIEHHGIKGQKWGVRRTPAQLGHATTNRMRQLSSKIDQARKQHTANVVAKNERKTARNKSKTARIESKNETLRKKAEQEELKTRIKNAKNQRKNQNGSGGNKSSGPVSSGLKEGIKNGVSSGTKNLVNTAISAAVTKHYSDVLADPNTSAGRKVFASLMGGDVSTSTHAREVNDRVDKIVRNGAAEREAEKRRLEALKKG